MTNEAMNWVWSMTTLDVEQTLVMLAAAACAAEDGTCVLGQEDLAARARATPQATSRVLGELEQLGLVTVRHVREAPVADGPPDILWHVALAWPPPEPPSVAERTDTYPEDA